MTNKYNKLNFNKMIHLYNKIKILHYNNYQKFKKKYIQIYIKVTKTKKN